MMKQGNKHLLLSLLALVTVFILAACGQSKQTAYYQAIDQNQKTDSRITIQYQGDKLLQNETVNTVYYNEAMGISKEALQQQLKDYSENLQDIKGFSHKAEFKDDHVVETTVLNYEEADMEELQKNQLVQVPSGQKADYISYKSTVDSFKQTGYKEVKDGKFADLK